MAFVVPAEIGHAPYAKPLLDFFVRSFAIVQIVAIREKLFPRLSEDCWLLYCDGYGGRTSDILFSKIDQFSSCQRPPKVDEAVAWSKLCAHWRGRLRPLLISLEARELYLDVASEKTSKRFGEFAKIGIGYISGDNDFFHMSPSRARLLGIPPEFLVPSVRRGRSLDSEMMDRNTIERWEEADEACYLLSLPATGVLPAAVAQYLATEEGVAASKRYKCRTRRAWYSVPGVQVPTISCSTCRATK